MITGKTTALSIWTSVGKVMSLLFNMLSRFVIAFLPRRYTIEVQEILDIRDTGRERDEGRKEGTGRKEGGKEMNDCLKAGGTSFTSTTLRSPFAIGRDLLEENAG